MRKPTVLLVDDKPANLLALELVLGPDYNLVRAESGEEAISLLKRGTGVDLILLDVQMPGMDGFEAAAHIKQMPGCKEIPIIFVTAIYTEDPFIRKGYEVGGIDYFSKPFDPEILRMKVAVYASFRLKAQILKERERHVRESEELLRVGRKLSSVLESLPVGVLIADVDGGICQTTEQVSRILKSVEPVQADSYGELLGWWDGSGQTIKDPEGPLARAIRQGETSHSERVAIQCFDGSVKTIVVSAAPLRGLDGRIVGAVILIQDLSETQKIQEDLEDRVTKLVSAGVELEETTNRQ